MKYFANLYLLRVFCLLHVIVVAGSEVHICVDVAKALAETGTRARVVSMPCWELFENQDEAYQVEGENINFHGGMCVCRRR